ncbi:DUF488 domain-containing protein [Riemerella anatipestifer]|uniref:DUF488 domain-containing protein n=1 Tax=Riemerella anatipestifer TaxID=34085 RepID=UPI00129E318C|nr:DUF488 domain-containing protein [Riemerella anatipestifer]MDY3547470.1 DUF488 domain-containing protein [Riemerella anatipestifer]MRM96825.1 DUF488 domain-containing protein [Riemerella anatipestifer]MRM99856.1 DUF488 domain-containing protein [Riemerella anatipestifer]MRN01782.1 DUF488 domain-containing protein [Riemerella anatipestifer]MRN16567.1 DUF488 domain-containing protein [Riemerella anatipestifer]
MSNTTIFSIGYGNLSLKNFIENLQKNDIEILVDVRSNAFSRFRPEFNKRVFEIILSEFGIKYIHQPNLGGKPKNEEFYTNGKLDYDKLRKSIPYLQGIEYLEAGLSFNYRMAVMCSELDYKDCHRYNLIGEDMVKRGWQVLHINKLGKTEPHQQIGLF